MHPALAGYQIELDGHALRRAGETALVEPQVFGLLVHLVRNRDRVASRDELVETIRHGRFVPRTALSRRINAARRAVGDGGNRQALIRTIHKPGFRFVGAIAERATVPAAEIATPARQSASVAITPPRAEPALARVEREAAVPKRRRCCAARSSSIRASRAHGALSGAHLQSSVLGDPTERARLLREALEQARIAAALDNQDSMTLCVLGPAHRFLHEYEAIELLEQSIVLNPGFVICWRVSGDSGVRRPRKPRQPTRSRSRSTSIGSSVPASS